MLTRWWFQIFFIFPPYLGKWSKMTNIFQMGWNHQLDNLVCFFMICWFFLFTTSPPPLKKQDFLLSTVESTRPYASHSFPSPKNGLVWNSCVARKPVAAHPMGYLLEIPLSNARPEKNSFKNPGLPQMAIVWKTSPFPRWIYPTKFLENLREQFKLPPQVSARRRCLVFALNLVGLLLVQRGHRGWRNLQVGWEAA